MANSARWKYNRWQRLFSIQNRIIVPYLAITVLVAAVGTYIVTRLVAGSLQERLSNQLLESGRVASDSVVRLEQNHIETLRLMALASGTDTAIETRNLDFLQLLMDTLGTNADIPDAAILDAEGNALVTRGTFAQNNVVYQRLPGVSLVLSQSRDDKGDKFSGISTSPPVFYVAGPVVSSQNADTLVGVVIVGTPLEEVLITLKRESLADVVLYDQQGEMLSTTFITSDTSAFAHLTTPIEQLQKLELKETRTTEVEVNKRVYQGIYAPFKLRTQTAGLMSVYLPSEFIVIEGGTSARIFSGLFGAAAFLIIFMGLLVARTIVNPVRTLVTIAQDVTLGDLTRRSRLKTQDEIGFLGFTFDIMTQRLEQRTRQLEAEAARLKTILAHSQTGMVMVTPKGKLAFMNQSAMRFLDVNTNSEEEILAVIHGLMELSARDKIEINNYILSTVTTRVTSSQTGEFIGTLVALNDITQEELTRQLKDRFITQVSHELRTPLTAIKGYGDLLETTVELGRTPRQEHLGGLLEQARLLDKMISELLSISQMSAGTFSVRRHRMDLRQTLLQTIQEELPHLRAAGLRLEKYFHPDPCWMEGDAQRLQWAFHHVFDNAVKYTPSGGKIICELSGNLEGKFHVVISDTGAGIRPVDQRYVFEAYFRREAVTPTGEVIDPRGMGLGLYIVHQVVKAHRGSVTLESTWGKGTTLIFTFPAGKTS